MAFRSARSPASSDLNRILQDIGSHRHLCHEFVERSPQCLDIGAGVELAVAQDGRQLELLLFAHVYFSRLGVNWFRMQPRVVGYPRENAG
jgi:hypothetical protein